MTANWITKTFVSKHVRLTKPREAVLRYLENRCTMFSASDILAAIPDLDKVSLYRTLDLFTAEDIIHPVAVIDGHQHYELHPPEGHHHHALCTECKGSECVDCPLPKKEYRHHVLSYTYICAACAS